MKFYHASINNYDIGQKLCVNDYDGNSYFYERLSQLQKKAEDALDMSRPSDIPCRKKCFFFFSEPSYCYYFASKQYPRKQINVYEVIVSEPYGGFPMCMVNMVTKYIEKNEDFTPIVQEYWHPVNGWNLLEYLGTCMTIKTKLGKQNSWFASLQYDTDTGNAKKLFNKCQSSSI